MPSPIDLTSPPQHHAQRWQHAQRGAVLMVMLVIMVVGSTTVLVNSLNASDLKITRQQQTVAALAKAKDALAGVAVGYSDFPGSLPCPDTNDDGESDAGGTTGCPQYIGRLPWKTLGLPPDLRDGAGEQLWYTMSRNLRRYDSARPLTSDVSGTLSITGTNTANDLVAIVLAPGHALPGQNRSTTQTALCATTNTTIVASRCASNYLEGNNDNLSTEANPVAGVNPNQNYQTAAASTTFNDQLIAVTSQYTFAPTEKRVAREVKICLDNYAAANGNKYPWAVPVADPSTLEQSAGRNGTLFGRLPTLTPEVVTIMWAKFDALRIAIETFASAKTETNRTAMVEASSQAQISANNVKNYYSDLNNIPVKDAAAAIEIAANDISNLNTSSTTTDITTKQQTITTKSNDFSNLVPSAWPNCTLFASTYWNDWKNLIFYQVANGYKPGSAASCSGSCLKIEGSGHSLAGSGNYRAVVVLAGKKLTSTRTVTNISDYLESANLLPQSDITKPYLTYRTNDPNYKTNNDLVLCVDGGNNC